MTDFTFQCESINMHDWIVRITSLFKIYTLINYQGGVHLSVQLVYTVCFCVFYMKCFNIKIQLQVSYVAISQKNSGSSPKWSTRRILCEIFKNHRQSLVWRCGGLAVYPSHFHTSHYPSVAPILFSPPCILP